MIFKDKTLTYPAIINFEMSYICHKSNKELQKFPQDFHALTH